MVVLAEMSAQEEGSIAFSSSVSFGDMQRVAKEGPEIVVCTVSDDDDSSESLRLSTKRKLQFASNKESNARHRQGYKLRAKIQGVERFNPLAKTAPEMALEKHKRLDKRRRELEDDARSAFKLPLADPPEDVNENVGPQVQESKPPPQPAWKSDAAEEAEKHKIPAEVRLSSRKRFKPSKATELKQHKPVIKKRKIKGGTREVLNDMLHQINESLRPDAVPGIGKKKIKTSSSTEPSRFAAAPAAQVVAPNPLFGAEPRLFGAAKAAASTCEKQQQQQKQQQPHQDLKIHKAFDVAIFSNIHRQDYRLPFETQRRRRKLDEMKALTKPKAVVVKQEMINDEDANNIKEEEGSDASSSSSGLVAFNNPGRLVSGENEFCVKLKQELSRPFSSTELQLKLGSVKRQKPIVKSRDLRGQRSIHFPTDSVGLSYLDHHPDFATVLKSATKPEEELSFLRGFFFWVEHACMEGSFRPWDSKKDHVEEAGVIVID